MLEVICLDTLVLISKRRTCNKPPNATAESDCFFLSSSSSLSRVCVVADMHCSIIAITNGLANIGCNAKSIGIFVGCGERKRANCSINRSIYLCNHGKLTNCTDESNSYIEFCSAPRQIRSLRSQTNTIKQK